LVEGEPVAAGAPLVLLNAELLQASRDRAQAQLEYDQRELDRVQELFQRGSVSARELDDARTRRAVSAATCAEETRQLERTKIVAPVAGVLNDMKVEVGEYAMAGKIVAEIVEVERVKVVVDVPERDIGRLHVGDGAAVVLPDDEVEGHITYISALADTQTRTTRVEITVDNRAGKLRSGQIVRARLTRNVLHDVIMIPLASVIPLEEGRLVYVVVDGKAQRRDVELGFMQGLDVQVVRGLQPGAQLIIDGQRYVGPDQTVTIVP
jgi:membrane fusion protein (multidrug efflux system)